MIGFAGIGTMGSGMARNLVKAGHQVIAYNRSKEKAKAVAAAVDFPASLCRADTIIMCVSNDAAIRDIFYGENGILSGLSSRHTLVDSSTTSVDLTAELADACSKKGAKFLDAPVTGGMKGANDGTLLYMVGGEKPVFEKILPIFQAMGQRIVYCGPSTYGQRMKIALNLTQAMAFEAYIEGLALALKEGLPMDVIREVFDNSGARSNVAVSKLPSILQRDFSPTFLLELMNKDHKLAQHEIRKLGMSLPLAEATIKVLQAGVDAGLAKEDWIAIAKILEEKNSVKFA